MGMDQLEISVYDIRTDGNISTLGEIFFEIPSGTIDVTLTVTFAGEEPIQIQVSNL